jgi:TRAP-type C4-dicarboxylate transport system substrate-binding protein
MRPLILAGLAFVILSILAITACSTSVSPLTAPALAEKTWNLNYAHENTPTEYYTVYGHIPFAQSIEKATNSRVKIKLYGEQTLIQSNQVWEGVKSGKVDISWLFTGYFPGQFPFIEVSALPFLYPDAAVGGKVTWKLFTKYPQIQSQFKDVKVLATWTSEPYFIAGRSKFFKTMDDFQGQKIRAANGPPADFVKALGGSPVMIGMPDVCLNLQNGALDAALLPAEAYAGRKIYEAAPYATYASTTAMVGAIVMNSNLWNSVPKDIQDQIMSASGETASVLFSSDVFDKSRQDMKDTINIFGGKILEYTLPQDELQRWIDKAGKPVWNSWVQTQKAAGLNNAQQILDDALALSKQYSSNK